jgi:hypothetical protein
MMVETIVARLIDDNVAFSAAMFREACGFVVIPPADFARGFAKK